MSRTLLLLRHAKSDWGADFEHDFERPLNKRGRRTIKRMARWMRTESLIPEHIVSSDAERARQTTLRLCEFADIPTDIVEWRHSVYEASVETLLEVVQAIAEPTASALLVGHNPGIEYLVRYLSDDSLTHWNEANLIPTTTLAHLIIPVSWAGLGQATAEVARIARPRQIFDE